MDNQKKITPFASGLIWFGAAVSIAEILTGTIIAPLGIARGIAAVITGHVIGAFLMYMTGLIGAKTGRTAMQSVQLTFGRRGGLLFSALNSVQLVGWTAVMILSGAGAASALTGSGSVRIWCAAISVLLIIWVVVGLRNLSILNTAAMALLLILTFILTWAIFRESDVAGAAASAVGTMSSDALSFGMAVELSAAMPVSWLPLISDYTCTTEKPKAVTLTATIVYFAASCWMFIIGLAASVIIGQSDISQIMISAGLGTAGLLIIIFSTVTTTFLDVYSASASMKTISPVFKERITGITVCCAGAVIAAFASNIGYEGFLYLIASVFAPMAAVQITDYYIAKRKKGENKYDIPNILSWICGFIIYRLTMNVDTPLGITFPVMIVTGIICLIIGKIYDIGFNTSQKMKTDGESRSR